MSIYCIRDALKEAECAIAFTGAGVSVESGIPDFRGSGGIWQRYPIEQYGTIKAFTSNPTRFWEFYFDLSRLIQGSRPNNAHKSLAWLEANGFLHHVITQNVDGFHQMAGNRDVVEVHGHGNRLVCLDCEYQRTEDVAALEAVPVCENCGAILKPDVVLFGEEVPIESLNRGKQYARQCDVCLVVGTCCDVYPAAGIPEIAFESGAAICQFDLEPNNLTLSGRVRYFVEGSAGETLPRLVDLLGNPETCSKET